MESVAKPRELPDTLSGLLRIAVEDTIAIENTPGYKLEMSYWYTMNGVCQVCMGGAVMLRSAAFVPPESLDSYAMLKVAVPRTLHLKMLLIDDMRKGYMDSAVDRLGLKRSTRMNSAVDLAGALIVRSYDSYSGHAPWETYLVAAGVLEKSGL